MDDLETLKIIKEKEQSINGQINTLKSEKEKELQLLESTFSLKLKDNEQKLRLQASKDLEETRKKAQTHADGILKDSKAQADKLKLVISDSDLEKLSREVFVEYVEGI